MNKYLYQIALYLVLLIIINACGTAPSDETQNEVRFSAEGQKMYNQYQKSRIKLSNGWSLTPAGKSIPLGDFTIKPGCIPIKKIYSYNQ